MILCRPYLLLVNLNALLNVPFLQLCQGLPILPWVLHGPLAPLARPLREALKRHFHPEVNEMHQSRVE